MCADLNATGSSEASLVHGVQQEAFESTKQLARALLYRGLSE